REKKQAFYLCRVSPPKAKRSPRRLLHLHLCWSLFPHNRLRLRHQRDLTVSAILHDNSPSSLPTRQTRNRFHLNHIRLQLQVTLICESLFHDNFYGKKNNYFLVKQFGRGNANSNNLYKLNCYRYSGLAYQKTVTIQVADKEKDMELGTTKTKKQNKLKLYVIKIFHGQFSFLLATPPLLCSFSQNDI
ncbi:hypothetical protein HID58_068521, partial [Brassica napus]